MPAKSKAQQRLFAIAEHNPSALYATNKSLANLPQQTLHDFAATKVKGKPTHVAKPKSPPQRNPRLPNGPKNRYGMLRGR